MKHNKRIKGDPLENEPFLMAWPRYGHNIFTQQSDLSWSPYANVMFNKS